jgi:carboxyl-terminal processing protease
MNEPIQYQHISAAADPLPPPTTKPQFWKYLLTVLVTVLVTFTLTAAAGTMLYLALGQNGPGSDNQANGQNNMSFATDDETVKALDKLKEAYDILDKQYFEELTDARMLEAMTSGLVNEIGSRYTMYLSAEQNSQLQESMSGKYVGIGATVSMNKNGLVEITEVIQGSPAETAGIKAGDQFVKVNDQDVTAMKTVEDVAALVRGDAGTTVGLVMYRPSAAKNVEFSVVRKQISSVSITSKMLTATIGYIQIREFSTGVSDKFIAAVNDLQKQGAVNIVFDLRNDGGGLATEVTSMLDYLLPKGVLATIEGRSNGTVFKQTWDSGASMGVPDSMRYVILINGMTASASELFSGCLRDYGKAWLIGEQSFGKGSGTKTFNLGDGSAINVTNFLYYLPAGDCIEGLGLSPDQTVELPAETIGLSIYQLTPEQDTQLGAAIDYLEKIN